MEIDLEEEPNPMYQELLDKINGLPSRSQVASPKAPKAKKALSNILLNLRGFFAALSPADKEILRDASTMRRILEDPILKLLAINKPVKLLNFKVDPDEEDLLAVDGN